uniref:Prostaglandin D2 synthase a n=1 Tax=Hucho hucho TaxID=62062 RepID=A0A4W5MME8_9TELE
MVSTLSLCIQFAGKWYRVGLAYDSPGFTAPYRDKLRVSMGILNPQTNGNVNLTMWTQRSSGCRSKLYMYEKTAIPGAFTYFSTRHNKVKDITVVETNYNEYALVLKHKKMDREYTQVALYGRSQKVKTEVIQKFRDFATSHGFPKDAILTPPSAGSSLSMDTHTHTHRHTQSLHFSSRSCTTESRQCVSQHCRALCCLQRTALPLDARSEQHHDYSLICFAAPVSQHLLDMCLSIGAQNLDLFHLYATRFTGQRQNFNTLYLTRVK